MSKEDTKTDVNINSNSGRDALHSFVERIERLEETKSEIADDIKDVFTEAKSIGFDTKVLRTVLRRRRMDREEREEFDSMVELYEGVLS